MSLAQKVRREYLQHLRALMDDMERLRQERQWDALAACWETRRQLVEDAVLTRVREAEEE